MTETDTAETTDTDLTAIRAGRIKRLEAHRDKLNRERSELEGRAIHFEREAKIARAAVNANLAKANRFTAAIEAVEGDGEFVPTALELAYREAQRRVKTAYDEFTKAEQDEKMQRNGVALLGKPSHNPGMAHLEKLEMHNTAIHRVEAAWLAHRQAAGGCVELHRKLESEAAQ